MGDLRIKDLVVEYAIGGEALRVIDGLNLEVPAGSLVIVLGPSGCGKTTLLSCIGGILSPTAGRIEVGDVDVTTMDRRRLTTYRRHTVGFVFQSFNLVPSLTALENVAVPLWAAGWSRRAARERGEELLTRFGLQDRMTHRPGDLSGGQRERVAVARAIALDPSLILADEPTAHLDQAQVQGVLRLLRELASGDRIVVVATHDTRILPFADHVVRLLPDVTAVDSEPQTVSLASGSVLFEQGSMGDLIYVVADGELEVVRESADGAEELVKIVTPGEHVGELGPLFRMARSTTVRARTEATVTGYTVEAFRRLLETYTEGRVIGRPKSVITHGNTDADRPPDEATLMAGVHKTSGRPKADEGSEMSAADKNNAESAEHRIESGWKMADYAPLTAPTLVGQLQQRAVRYRDKLAFTFSRDGEEKEVSRLSYQQLDAHARQIAADLQGLGAAGERVLVLCPPGPDFIAGLFGCLYAGAVAVPMHPPVRDHLVPRVEAIIADAQPGFALSTAEMQTRIRATVDGLVKGRPLRWSVTDTAGDDRPWVPPDIDAGTVAMLQYTSGSTATPKGVVLSHGNLVHNLETIRQTWKSGFDMNAHGVFWLPPYHDMGLIGGILETLYVGGTSALMPPGAFIKRPMRWLEAMSRHQAVITAAPNFSYDLCVELSTPEERASLDLSNWSIAMCGAEPVRPATLQGFADAFAPAGFRPEAFYPVYGLAEATLLVSGGSDAPAPVVRHIDRVALRERRVAEVAPENRSAATLVGCGRPQGGQRVVIVDPETRRPSEADEVGEIWVAGPSVAQGYWQKPEETEAAFSAHLADTGDGPFFRTGDLGFLASGELFVTGRRKDLIIIRGSNHYPEDIELTVQACHPALLRSRGAVFSVASGPDAPEQLVVVQEVNHQQLGEAELTEIVDAIRTAVTEHHEIQADAVVLVEPLRIPTTSSGKIQRSACRQQFIDSRLEAVAEWHVPRPAIRPAAASSEHGGRSAAEIADWFVSQLSSELGIPATDIDPSRPFAYYGLDSVRAIRLTAALESWLGSELSPTLAYEYPTIDLLSRHLAEQVSATDRTAAPAGDGASRATDEPIAIIGIGCRFPGADGPAAFWRELSDGVDAISEIPPDRWDADAFYDADPSVPGTSVTRRAGFVPGIDKFDFRFFGISPRESAQMDPQQRLILEVAWEALEDAGQVPERLAGSDTGVFVGISTTDYANLRAGQFQLVDAYTGTGNALSIAANRLSYFYDFHGPSMAIDTACSSSLVAVHLACRSLRDGECSLALAGGVNVILSPALMINFTKAKLMAPDGRSKTFDAGADGYVRGEGAGIVVLKPLSRALADNDPIYAVIRGTATNQDGRTNGLIAPSRQSQEAVLAAAYRRAGLSPGTAQYVEAHGTGTFLGDAIEANALGTILADGRPPGSPCLIGSVKTNIGHLEAAAGVAGLIKVALALKHKAIPPSLNFVEPNPEIPFDSLPVRVAQTLTPWPENGGRAVASVSSFGMGGTNAHAVLTEAPQVRPAVAEPGPAPDRAELLPLSARSPEALAALADRYESVLGSGVGLADLCYTAGAHRGHLEHRLSVVADSPAAMSESLTAYRQGQSRPGISVGQCRPGQRPNVVFVFPGQGSQWQGMGQRLQAEEPVFREALAACERAIQPYLGSSVLEALAKDEELTDIGLIQPAIFAIQVALAALWRSWGAEPTAVVGHSMGEVAAAHVAGALSLEDAARVICTRALMLRTVRGRGTMMAAELSLAEAEELIAGREREVAIAASNSHRSTVLSGDQTVLAELMAELQQRERFCRWVDVDVAAHSPQMDALVPALRAGLAGLRASAPAIPIYSTVTGDLLTDRLSDADYWAQNLRSSVHFSPALRRLLDGGHDAVVEISPHPVLLTSIREDAEDVRRRCTALPSMRRDAGGRATALASLGTLYTLGQPIAWERLYPAGSHFVAAPTYPWQRVHSWMDVGITAPSGAGADLLRQVPGETTEAAGLRDWMYQLRWQPASLSERDGSGPAVEPGSWLVLGDGGITTDTLRDHLESHFQTCVLVEPGRDHQDFERLTPNSYRLDPTQPEHFRRLLEDAFTAERPPCRGVVHLWNLLAAPPAGTSPESLETATTLGPVSVLHLVQALARAGWSTPPRLWLVTGGAQVTGTSERTSETRAEPVSIAQAPVWGMARTIEHEHPELRCTCVDLSADGGPDEVPRESLEEVSQEIGALFQEVWADRRDGDVALRGSRRYVERLTHYDAPEPTETAAFKKEASYLITGGLGAIGLVVAKWMAEHGARHLVVMGRGGPSAPAQETLDTLRAAGTEVIVAQGDVAKADEVAGVLESIGESMPPLRGVVHAAGIADDAILQCLDERKLRKVMAPKVQGAWNLHALTRDAELDFFVLFSSAASLLGPPGAANYAAANAFLDALAWHRRGEGRPALSVNWGPWAELGFFTRSELQNYFAQYGVEAMSAADSLRALSSLLARSATQAVVLDIDWTRWQPDVQPPLLAELGIVRSVDKQQGKTAAGPGSGLYDALQGAAPEERQRLLESYLCELAAGKLGLTPSALDIQAPLNTLGVDSLITLELRMQVERDLGLVVPVTRLLQGPSVASLAKWLRDNLPLVAAGTSATSPDGAPPQQTAPAKPAPQQTDGAPSRGIDLLTRVPELSDDAVEEMLQKVLAERGAERQLAAKEGSDDG
ncbi:SDR family NAD(P)-dependent oxidoreductase [Mycobacterium sp.]|uniref:SDR family NAD(P)-dependent oxidoreductase n=1 Tax=Mycobacterium sp. TaxID=1785 RepID=UPI002CA9FB6B|nr:SDR family NAD(P)-dependent oxidoreductase [Mycobacterium sp.]HTY32522.1 SDR family NAD(P)-dependent oxidoreductase [Mycobacterium sp.]